jgi:hypothetical protein
VKGTEDESEITALSFLKAMGRTAKGAKLREMKNVMGQ